MPCAAIVLDAPASAAPSVGNKSSQTVDGPERVDDFRYAAVAAKIIGPINVHAAWNENKAHSEALSSPLGPLPSSVSSQSGHSAVAF